MQKKPRTRYKVWLKQAQYDLEISKISFENNYFEWAAYQAEQCVEKALKSIIAEAGQTPPKMHKISVLVGYSNSLNKAFRDTKLDFRHLESFTFISRYPFLIPGKEKSPHELISLQDAKKCIQQADKIFGQVKEVLEKEAFEEGIKLPGAVSEKELERRLDEVKGIITRDFDPEKIVLFGSYSRKPLPKHLSTIDLLVIAKTKLKFVERIKQVRKSTRGGVPTLEALVYTPEEFKLMTEEEGESFFEEVLREGKVLYDKTNKGNL